MRALALWCLAALGLDLERQSFSYETCQVADGLVEARGEAVDFGQWSLLIASQTSE